MVVEEALPKIPEVNPHTTIPDATGRPFALSEGRAIEALVGA
jgi:hypothetical protein